MMTTEANKGPPEIVGFLITPDTNISRSGEHKGLRYKISNHGRYTDWKWRDQSRGTWCYYVYIPEYALSANDFAKFWLSPSESSFKRSSGIFQPQYDYGQTDWSDADWHGGVTWYAKLGGLDGAPRCVEIGCDFSHSWDDGGRFNYAAVESEAKRTIDVLAAQYPFLSRCSWSGKHLPKEQMVEHEGRIYAPDALIDMLRFRQEA